MLTVMTYMVTTNSQGKSPEQEDKSYQRKAVTCQSTRSATLALPKQDAAAFEASSSSQGASKAGPKFAGCLSAHARVYAAGR